MTPAPNRAPKRRNLLLATAAALCPLQARAETVKVWLPRHISTTDPQLIYVRRLVTLALERAGFEAAVKLVDLEMAQARSLIELSRGDGPLDLMWTMTDRQRESSACCRCAFPSTVG